MGGIDLTQTELGITASELQELNIGVKMSNGTDIGNNMINVIFR